MAIGRHGQRPFGVVIVCRVPLNLITIPSARAMRTVGAVFFFFGFGEPSCLFAGAGHGFLDPLPVGRRLRAKAAVVNHGKQHQTLLAECGEGSKQLLAEGVGVAS